MDERTQQLAVLLNIMGEDNAQTALDGFDADVASQLSGILNEYKSDPPSMEEIELVLDDFERFFNFAYQQYQSSPTQSESKVPSDSVDNSNDIDSEEEAYDAKFDTIITFSKPNLTGDVNHDLNLLHPYQVAKAIRNDNPNSIAVVINVLNNDHAGQTMENLPKDVRLEVFLRMAEPKTIAPEVQEQILKAALESALKVEQRVAEVDRTGQMVALARSLPKNIRAPLMDKLAEEFEELAEDVKKEMYQFEDIAKLEDRDIQKVLGQSDTDSLVLALVSANDSLKQRLLNNMSKRARQTIEEELEFRTNASEEEIDAGKREIVGVLMRMDEEGEISLE